MSRGYFETIVRDRRLGAGRFATLAGAASLTLVVRQTKREGRVGYIHTTDRTTRHPTIVVSTS